MRSLETCVMLHLERYRVKAVQVLMLVAKDTISEYSRYQLL